MNEPIRFPWKPITALLVFHAGMMGLALGGVMLLGHLQCRQNSAGSMPRASTVQLPRTAKFEDSKQYDPRLLPVNERARSEVKQAEGEIKEGRWVLNPNTGERIWCPDCPASRTPTAPPAPPQLRPNDKTVSQPVQHQIMLFLIPGDPLSDRLERWFDTDPTLMRWRSGGTFHKFTANNRLYQTLVNRGVALREQMPPTVFPAALFTAPDGGHIHAAIKQFIPDTPEQLIADVGRGKLNWKSMHQSIPGNVPIGQYNFDDAINFKTRLNSDQTDCVGPNCPIPSREPRRPGARIVDLFPHAGEKVEGVVKDAVWGWLDIVVTGVIALCVLAACVFALLVFALLVAYIVRSRRTSP